MTSGMLVDSNVVIAAIASAHPHHVPSALLLQQPAGLAMAGHSYAEVFVQLTRQGPSAPVRMTADEAWAAIQALTMGVATVGLTPSQTLESVREYASMGGIGARLYDWLIGRTAVEAGIKVIVTWNVRHMHGLFPDLDVMTPDQALA